MRILSSNTIYREKNTYVYNHSQFSYPSEDIIPYSWGEKNKQAIQEYLSQTLIIELQIWKELSRTSRPEVFKPCFTEPLKLQENSGFCERVEAKIKLYLNTASFLSL